VLSANHRIWGDQGQTALEKASICLLNCGPTGTEALKNLVLGGIGSVTAVDGSKVEASDLGNNFMCNFFAMWFHLFFWIHPQKLMELIFWYLIFAFSGWRMFGATKS
jgi:hypothetical protein